jgi:hypothetical protein
MGNYSSREDIKEEVVSQFSEGSVVNIKGRAETKQ